MKYLMLLPIFLLFGCYSSVPVNTHGHWGDRSDWHSDYWTQDYFADSDSHLVGWIDDDNALSIRAHCGDGEFSLSGIYIGAYETQEDAQAAVEKNCPTVIKKN